MAFFRPRLLSADESGSASARLGLPATFQGTGLAGSWLVAGGWNWRPDDGSRWAVRLAEWLNSDVTAGTFRESLRLTDSRAVPRTGKKTGLPSPGDLAIRHTWSSVTVMA
jgi:hypothetical protein